MKPLFVLLSVFAITLVTTWLLNREFGYLLSGRVAMSVMLLFTSIGHFKFTEGMNKMMPENFPFKKQWVYVTGLIEIAAAIGLVIPSLQKLTGWLLIIFFLLILPVNINAALKHVDYEKGTYEGPGATYLWFRVPLQILFMTWVYFFAIRN